MKKEYQVIAIVGPTASGKSDFAVDLAHALGGPEVCEIISADSRQVYKDMNYGTGKITPKEMRGIRHHLIDVISPYRKQYTVADYVRDATKALHDIIHRHKIAIVVGGTGFYIDAFLRGITIPHVEPDPQLRTRLSTKSASDLYNMLETIDPDRARDIDKHNPVRLIRAIEIATALGKVPRPQSTQMNTINTLFLGIDIDNETLQQRIRYRFYTRMKQGMLDEARTLHKKGLSWKRMEQFGLEYRYMALLLQKKISPETFEKELLQKIYQYAKRQKTWFKRHKDITWLE